MSDASSGTDASQVAKQAMGKASGMYNEAVGQAGPGMAANASLLLTVLIAVGALINFLDADGKFKEKFYYSFNPSGFLGGGLGLVGIIIVGGLLISRVVVGDIMPLNKKMVLSLLGLVGAIVGVLMVISTL